MKKMHRVFNIRVDELTFKNSLWIWAFFFVFAVSNGFLAYSPCPLPIKIWIFLVGIFVPFFIFVRAKSEEKMNGEKASPNQLIRMPAIGIWIFLLVPGLYFRFFKLTSFHLWPNGDEGLQGYFAIELVKKWDWRFFYTSGQHPPLLIWILKFLFQFVDNAFFNLWMPPAFFSALTFVSAYSVSKQFFSKAESFIFSMLMAFSFWPLLFGRFCVQGALVPFFEFPCFYLLGRFFKAPSGPAKDIWAGSLGLFLGLGCLTFTSWITVIFFVASLVFIGTFRSAQNSWSSLFVFIAFFFIGFSPWLIAASREGFGGYLLGVSFFSGFFTWKQQFLTSVSSLTSLFWGPVQTEAGYGPTWGGVLNPLLDGCFLLGAAELVQTIKKPVPQALVFGFLLFLAPGFAAADHVEMFRIIPVMPVLLIIVMFGITKLLRSVSYGKRIWILVSLMGFSFLADFYHFLRPQLVQAPSGVEFRQGIEDENFQAFQLIKGFEEQKGPGFVFSELMLLSRGHSLRVAVYPFNAGDNPSIDANQATWAALVVNAHYGDYLAKRFPRSQWSRIEAGEKEDGGLAVGFLPLEKDNRDTLFRWLKAQDYVRQLAVQSENMMNNPDFYQSVWEKLTQGYPLMEGDPFLESFYGEWIAQYHFTHGLERNISALRRAVAKGYPAANLYYKLGNFLFLNRQYPEAKKAYLMAARCHLNYTNAKEVLARLWGGRM